ncbi:MAG TPA: sugar ABC transporter permease, partial [Tepidisphaeraceae bacterium]|nr:sugar ABC transporter permease [Tepidisphaeraceae bacterium]
MLPADHAGSKPPSTWWALQARLAPYLFICPFVVLFSVFMLWPLVRSVILSFYQTAGTPSTIRFVGLDNFIFLVQDPTFYVAILNTLGYTLAFVLIQLPAALLLAVILNSKRVRGRNLFRFAFFAPHLVGQVFVAVIFGLLLANNGPINALINQFLPTAELNWKTDPILARPAVIIASLWLSVGYGMQAIDRDLYEAAAVDGAGRWAQFWHITLPGIRPVLIFMILVTTIGGFQLFELPYVLFQGGGPGQAGLTIVSYLFGYGIEIGDIGYAAAIGW